MVDIIYWHCPQKNLKLDVVQECCIWVPTKSVFCETRGFQVSSGLSLKTNMAQIQLKLGMRRVVITALLATFAGVPIAVMFHELHLQSIDDNINSHLTEDTLTEIPQLVSIALQSK